MGVRLYPITKNRENLEKLANVPPGTYDRLDKLKEDNKLNEQCDFFEHQKRYENFYNSKSKDRDLDTLDDFLLFGWGKFNSAGIAENYAGSITDPILIKQLFTKNGINANIELCEGICWG